MDATIIGAASALAGVALSQVGLMLQSRLARNHQKSALQVQKLEELTESLQQSIRWSLVALDSAGQDDRTKFSESFRISYETQRILVLALLYFPTLQEESKQLWVSSNSLYVLVTGEKAIIQETFLKVFSEFSDRTKSLEKLIVQEAQRLA